MSMSIIGRMPFMLLPLRRLWDAFSVRPGEPLAQGCARRGCAEFLIELTLIGMIRVIYLHSGGLARPCVFTGV